jgi:hypothetical protein
MVQLAARRVAWLLAIVLTLAILAPAAGVSAQETAETPPATDMADGEDTYRQLRAGMLSQPLVFGPESGELVHDPDRVTVLPTGVSLRDFAVRVECIAPISAAEGFWDCGLFFRDVVGGNHFRLGIVSDQTWFLSIGADAPLQSGSGIDVGVNSSDRTTLELFAIGTRGYFGINGRYVSTLDLSAIVQPGDITVATSFFADTYIEGDGTEYKDLIIWSYDPVGETPSPIATPDEPTSVPTEPIEPPATPVLEIPTAIATPEPTLDVPAETPTATEEPAEATPAPIEPAEPIEATPVVDAPSIDITIDPVVIMPSVRPADQPTAEPGVIGVSYISPTYGYGLSWDPSWRVEIESSEEAVDYLRISNGTITADLLGYEANLTPAQCIQTNLNYYENEPGYDDVAIVNDANGQPVVSIDSTSSTVLLSFTYTDADGLATQFYDYLICVSLPGGVGVAHLEQYVLPEQFAELLPTMQGLQENFVVFEEAPAVATPVAEPTEAVAPAATPTQEIPRPPGTDPSMRATFVLEPVNESGITGSGVIAVLEQRSALTAIVNNAPDGAYLGIVRGGCTPEAEPAYRVGTVDENGVITTEVRVRLPGLLNRDVYGVVVYPSEADLDQPLACGEIVSE